MQIKLDKNIFIFIGLSAMILWQMLLPGYILTLDMIFTPYKALQWGQGAIYNSAPLWYGIQYATALIPGWIVQKFILLVLFFLIGYLPFKYIPLIWREAGENETSAAGYWPALFYAVNPFVYERMLAGHWTHLFAYAFLPPFVLHLYRLCRRPSFKNSVFTALWLALIGVFSLHFFVMAAIIAAFSGLIALVYNIINNRKKAAGLIAHGLFSLAVLVVACSYWLAPLIIARGETAVSTFDETNWEAYATAPDSRLGTAGNVLALYGFWGESQPWINYFILPKDNTVIFLSFLILLAALILIGVIYSWKRNKYLTLAFLFFCFLAFLFSVGIGDTPFRKFNYWLFENIGFWRGFRDTQKWSGWLALGYAYFGGLGVIGLGRLMARKIKKDWLAMFLLLPVFYTFTLPGGFARQLQPVWYPESWDEAKRIIDEDKSDSKVLFLPWHGYLSFDFNNKLPISNPATQFFGPRIVKSGSTELGRIYSQNQPAESAKIEAMILAGDEDVLIDYLNDNGFGYIIFAHDLEQADNLEYGFLGAKGISPVLAKSDLTLFKITDMISNDLLRID